MPHSVHECLCADYLFTQRMCVVAFFFSTSITTSTTYLLILHHQIRIEPSCTAKAGGKDKTAVTAVAFAPRLLRNGTASPAAAVLAIGLESGTIELWSVGLPLPHQSASYHFLCAVPRNLSHISTVKGLAFRPQGVRGEKDDGDEGGTQHTLASCGIDNGVRIYCFHLLKK